MCFEQVEMRLNCRAPILPFWACLDCPFWALDPLFSGTSSAEMSTSEACPGLQATWQFQIQLARYLYIS